MNRWPVYTANETGTMDACGHQHGKRKRAIRCAENNAKRYPTRQFTVMKRLRPRSGEDEGRMVATGIVVGGSRCEK